MQACPLCEPLIQAEITPLCLNGLPRLRDKMRGAHFLLRTLFEIASCRSIMLAMALNSGLISSGAGAGAVFAASESCFCAPSEFLLSPERLPSAFNKFNNANFSVIKFPF